MRSKTSFKYLSALLLMVILSLVAISGLSAQDAPITETPATEVTLTPLATETPVEVAIVETAAPVEIEVSSAEPVEFTEGTGGILTINGSNFTSSTTVSLNDSIVLPITSQDEDTLTVSIGSDVPTGVYPIEVSDPTNGTEVATSLLTVSAAVPQLSVAYTEPSQITTGQARNLSVIGSNLTSSTTVRLNGFGFLTTTFLNSNAITAALPATLPVGQYSIEISDSSYGTANSPNILVVYAVAATATPVVTATPQPTAIPGQPELIISQFSASPANIKAGETTQITFTVMNVGSRTAEGIVVSLGNGDFTPANGQGSLTIPNLSAYASYSMSFSVAAPMDAAEGPQSIPLVLSSRDFSGETYTDNAVVSVMIAAETTGESQIVLDSYQVTPNDSEPGTTVTVQALFKNTGTETASQVLVEPTGTNSVLLAGLQGNAFSLGDIPAGTSVPIVMSFVVASSAEAGAQSQSFNISYLQDGDSKQSTASLSLQVKDVVEQSPLLLLQSYSSGQDDALTPGQQFTFQMTLQNAGAVDISNLLVTFGTVDTGSDSATGTGESSNSSTSTSSSSFAIYGSGGTVLLGNLAAGQTSSLTQDFLVSSDLTSGIHDLPITLQYQEADGTDQQKTLSASLLVVVPPNIRITTTSTLADPLTANTDTTLAVKIANLGSSDVAFTTMHVTGDNATISEGAETTLDPMASDDDTTETVVFVPQAEGPYTVTVKVDYIDELNQAQTITQTFSGEVTAQAAQQNRPRRDTQAAATATQNEPSLGRLLLGFLGIGG